jgi:hypothetical protein
MIPAMIVLMGNFSAAATSNAADADYPALREGFTQLARLIDTYSTIKVRVCLFVRCGFYCSFGCVCVRQLLCWPHPAGTPDRYLQHHQGVLPVCLLLVFV